MSSIITPEQKRQYAEDGYVLVPDLIAPEIVERATAALWRELNADPNDAATWRDLPWARGFRDADIVACFTPEFEQAAAELARESVSAPSSAYMLNVFPQEGPWRPQGPHIDHAIPKDGFRVFPRPMRVASIAYLNEVPPHGASTVVWPGSFKKNRSAGEKRPGKIRPDGGPKRRFEDAGTGRTGRGFRQTRGGAFLSLPDRPRRKQQRYPNAATRNRP